MAWRPRPRDLDRILACRYARVVTLDNTVAFFGDRIELPPGPRSRSHARRRVEVRELLDGRVLVLDEGQILAERPAPAGPFTLTTHRDVREERRRKIVGRATTRPPATKVSKPQRPRAQEAHHPWKKTYKNVPRHHRGTPEGF